MNTAKWWRELDVELQQKLMADPYGPVPTEVVAASGRDGAPTVAGAWWPAMSEGPRGFEFADDVQEFIEGRRLWSVWARARREHTEFLRRYFGMGGGDFKVEVPEESVTAEVLEESERMAEAERSARSAWVLHRRTML